MVKHLRHSVRGERAAVAVEFALIVPIFLALVFGIIQFSIYFWAAQTGTSVANAAVRKMSVGDCQDLTELTTFVKNRLGSANQGGFTLTRAYADSAKVAVTAPTPPGTMLPQSAVGGTVTLTISFKTLDMHLPLPVPHTVTKQIDARIEDNSQDSLCTP